MRKTKILRDGDTWYKMDAVKWLIQAMGRAHRHQNDYGAVVVLDSRLDNTFSEFFPPWIKQEFTEYNNPKRLCVDLHYFYQNVFYKQTLNQI
jgi:Rad3-related DNA helicase